MNNKKIASFWSPDTGTTDGIAESLVEKIGNNFDIKEINMIHASEDQFEENDYMIFGLSTWYDGQLQSDWDYFFDKFCNVDFTGKTVAIFGLGDQYGYEEYYVDGVGTIGEQVLKAGGKLIGWWPAEGYFFTSSKAILKPGWFCGLALDEENQSDLTDERLEEWSKKITEEFLAEMNKLSKTLVNSQ